MALSGLPSRWWSPSQWSRGDRIALALLAIVPVALFVVPALAGHPAIAGDNSLQNYPLRVLSGRQIAAGHWPVWNSLADSGTPLLGGLNAGSFYPGSLLFVFLPGLVAWTANLVAVYWCAAVGLYVLARWLGTGPVAACLAAATYAFSGAMVGQLVHVGVVQGQAWLPWLVLSQLVLARSLLGLSREARARDVVRRAAPGVLGVAAVVAMVCLTGEPRSIADAEMVALLVLVVELVAHGGTVTATVRGRVAYTVATVVGLAWGVALSLAQLLPGWGFIALSERSSISYSFFGAGSLRLQWLPLLLSQGLLGTNGTLGTSSFFGSYNLPEVTGYVGVLALTALFAFGAQLCRRTSPAARRQFVVFFAIAVGGIALTLGNTTPLGPALHLIPLFGHTRLQNRNLALFDLGAAVLLAWWFDAVVRGRADEASLVGRRRLATLAPAAATAVLCAAALASPRSVARLLPAPAVSSAVASGVRLAVLVSFCVAVAAVIILAAGRRRTALTVRALLVVAVVDLVGFNVFFQSGLISGLSSTYPNAAAARAAFGTEGRIAIVDQTVDAYHESAPLGLANLNVFTGLASVQGYGSLISQRYSAATGTRHIAKLDGCALAHGVFVPLRLAAIAVAPEELVVSREVRAAPHGCAPPGAHPTARRYFGRVAAVSTVSFSAVSGGSLDRRTTRVTLLDSAGRPIAARDVLSGARTLRAGFPTRPAAAGVVLTEPSGVRLRSVVLTTAAGDTLVLDTPMQVGLDSPGWRFTMFRGELSFFKAVHVAPRVWTTSSRGTARVVASSSDGGLTVAVSSATPTTLVRSEAWLPGWVARVSSTTTSASRVVAVRHDGLVQAVAVPAGSWTVAFSYDAPHLRAGLASTALALVAMVVALAWLVRDRRRDGVRPR